MEKLTHANKEDWEYKKLGEVCNIKTGKLDANASVEGGKYPFFTCSKNPLSINTYSYDCECLLLAGNGELNVKYYKGKFDAYQRTYIIQLKKNINISIKYLYFFFNKFIYRLKELSIGGVIKYIKIGHITEGIIPIPPLPQQLQIVQELDLLNTLIEKKKEQLQELDKLAQATFYKMFGDPVENEKGWGKKEMAKVCKFSQGIQIPIEQQSLIMQDGWKRFLRISDYTIPNTEVRYVNVSDPKYLVNRDDIAIVRYGASAGTAGFNKEGILANNLFKLNHDKQLLDSSFLMYFLNTEYYIHFIEKVAFGAAMPALSFGCFKSFYIYIPPLPLQHQFAAKIEAINLQKELIKQSLTDIQQLLDYTMNKYFG